MPVYRGPDGKIIEEKSEKRKEDTKPTDVANRPSPPAPQVGEQPAGAGRLDAPTQRMGESRAPSNVGEEERTRLVGGRRRQEDEERWQERAEEDRGMDDPVVGWLVVVEGPGKGRAGQLGYGSNSIGRGRPIASSWTLATIRFRAVAMPLLRTIRAAGSFTCSTVEATNLTYLGDQPVLSPTELSALSHISIGNTVLRFVPLCGAEFDWQDTEGSEAR